MEDWTKFSDEKVFTKVGEDPGTRAAYWRDTEIRRREYLLNRALLRTQSAAVLPFRLLLRSPLLW
jgi:hypothetical protein